MTPGREPDEHRPAPSQRQGAESSGLCLGRCDKHDQRKNEQA